MLLFVYSLVACESARSWFVVVLLVKSYIIIFLLSRWARAVRPYSVFSLHNICKSIRRKA